MREKLLLTLFAGLIVVLIGCSTRGITGSGRIEVEERELEAFDGLTLEGTGEVYIKQGFENKVLIQTDDNILPYLKTEIIDGTLYLGLKNSQELITPSKAVFYHVTTKNLNKMNLSGSGRITTEQPLSTEVLRLQVSGSGRMNIDIDVKDLDLSIAGSGAVEARGGADRQEVTVSGSGNYNGLALKSLEADITISGSGYVLLNVVDNLNANISGDASVRYKGMPKVNSSVFGSGKLMKF